MLTVSNERRHERGAVLVHVSIIMVAMIAFSALAVDYGVMFVSRRQAQNAADAAALAAGVSLSFVNPNNFPLAQNSGVAAAQQNNVWGQAPDVLAADISMVNPCPPGSPGVAGTCVRADVFRTSYQGRANGSPLPTFFANIVGVSAQGTRASATSQLRAGTGTADCVKPVAIPDRWLEFNPSTGPWTPTSTFSRYRENGANRGSLLSPADQYVPPTANSAGSGYTLAADYGTQVLLKEGDGGDAIDPAFYYPIVLNPGCNGGNCYRDAWQTCSTVAVGPGTVFNAEPGNKVGPTRQGVQALIDADPSASWSASANGGRGGPVGGCMAAGTCGRSPRWVAIAVFNVDLYQYNRAVNNDNGRNTTVTIVKVLGFWLEPMQGNDVIGRIMYYPTTSFTGTAIPGPGMFAGTIVLVR